MPLVHSPSSRVFWRVDILAFITCVLVFWSYPQIDLIVSGLFYSPENGFFLGNNPLVLLSYRLFARLQFVVLGLLLLSWIVARFYKRAKHRYTRAVVFLFLLLLMGPGLIVNMGLKENWGRARPREVTEFGGQQQFTPALIPASQCDRNCSFVSGHAALGFYLIGVAWVIRKRRWLVAGIILGSLVGAGRILQGGHFLGDVIFSFWAVYFSAVLLDWLSRLLQQAAQPEEPIGVKT